jgi:hypothetical protein
MSAVQRFAFSPATAELSPSRPKRSFLDIKAYIVAMEQNDSGGPIPRWLGWLIGILFVIILLLVFHLINPDDIPIP